MYIKVSVNASIMGEYRIIYSKFMDSGVIKMIDRILEIKYFLIELSIAPHHLTPL